MQAGGQVASVEEVLTAAPRGGEVGGGRGLAGGGGGGKKAVRTHRCRCGADNQFVVCIDASSKQNEGKGGRAETPIDGNCRAAASRRVNTKKTTTKSGHVYRLPCREDTTLSGWRTEGGKMGGGVARGGERVLAAPPAVPPPVVSTQNARPAQKKKKKVPTAGPCHGRAPRAAARVRGTTRFLMAALLGRGTPAACLDARSPRQACALIPVAGGGIPVAPARWGVQRRVVRAVAVALSRRAPSRRACARSFSGSCLCARPSRHVVGG